MKKFFIFCRKVDNVKVPETIETKPEISEPEISEWGTNEWRIEDGVAKQKETEAADLEYAFDIMKLLGVVQTKPDLEKLLSAMEGSGVQLV